MAKLRTLAVALFLTVGVLLSLPHPANAASCDAFVSKWAWFIGGEVTVNPDGTFVQQSGNAGTWECTDPARGRVTMRWRDGGFVNSLVVSPDGQGLTSTDLSQSYVTARRSSPVPTPQLVRKEDCCQEEYGCEVKRIEAEFDQKVARCHHPGNAACFKEAVSTKASQLKTANEKLRLCNRTTGNEGISSGLEPGGALPPVPASNDEFHSTEGVGRANQACQPCGAGPDQSTGGVGDTFGSNSPGSDKDSLTPPTTGSQDDADCLPQVDPQVLAQLQQERNDILHSLAGGGYVGDLTLRAMGKLIAARLEHIKEPNEGIASRTARAAQSAIEYAPEAVVNAGKAVAGYLANDNASNHRYLYGQVEIAVSKAEQQLKQQLRNPHITIAAAADTLLVGKATGTVGMGCRQWTSTKIMKFKNTTDEALKASKVYKGVQGPPSIPSICGTSRTPRKDCFWQTLANATGDRSYLLRQNAATRAEVSERLKQHFGGSNAKDPMTRRIGDLQKIAEGEPVHLTPEEFANVLQRLPDNAEGMIFSIREDIGHAASLAKLAGRNLFWDNQQRTSNMDKILAGGKELFWYRYK